MAQIKVKQQKLVDFSFMPSLKCNLQCPNCMYEASPQNNTVLDFTKTEKFISTIDFQEINSIGFYGGEISCDYKNYQKIINLISKKIVKFTITNGTWSTNEESCERFISFISENNLQVFVSTNDYLQNFQNMDVLDKFVVSHDFVLGYKNKIIPMGRAYKSGWVCSRKCVDYVFPMRLTLNPYGKVMFCNCDGVYPIIGTYKSSFNDVLKIGSMIENFCNKSF